MLKFKIQNTRKLHEINKRHVGVEREIHYMKICEFLLKRLIEDEYYWMHFRPINVNNKQLLTRANNSRKVDKEYLFYILEKRIDIWWD